VSQLFFVSYISLWLSLVLVGILVLLLYRHFGLLAMSTAQGHDRDGIRVGDSAPAIPSVTSSGEQFLWSASTARPQLLVFGSPDCEPCKTIIPYLSDLAARRHEADVTFVANGPREVAVRLIETFKPSFLCLADDGTESAVGYRVKVTPFAFVVGEDGRVRAKGLCPDPVRLQNILFNGGLKESAELMEAAVASYRTQKKRAVQGTSWLEPTESVDPNGGGKPSGAHELEEVSRNGNR